MQWYNLRDGLASSRMLGCALSNNWEEHVYLGVGHS